MLMLHVHVGTTEKVAKKCSCYENLSMYFSLHFLMVLMATLIVDIDCQEKGLQHYATEDGCLDHSTPCKSLFNSTKTIFIVTKEQPQQSRTPAPPTQKEEEAGAGTGARVQLQVLASYWNGTNLNKWGENE